MTPEELQAIRERANNASPGPWEYGDRYHVQGADYCDCNERRGPLISEKQMWINGKRMLGHVHAAPEPWWERGIVHPTPDGPMRVVTETEEYGVMDPADGEFIAHARTDIPALLDHVDWLTKALTVARRLRDKLTHINSNLTARLAAVRELHREGRNSCCAGGTICDHCEKRWPCPTIQALEGDT